MTDLISRQDALDAIKVSMNIWSSMPEWREHKIIECLEELPSAQPEIVRCKDCKHSEHWYRDKRRCFLWNEAGIDVFEDGFCNYAERREDG